ncbi:MAG: DUF421 domain-containing protein [Lutisporaceae bacterium]
MLIIFIRAAILYIFIVIIIRVMGKKQIGEMQPTELVLALVIADLSAVPMESLNTPILYGIIPILTLFIIEETLSYIALKSDKARGIIYGKPSIIIEHGRILEAELRKLNFNINDLLEQLRLNGFTSVDDVEFAILETNGKLSTVPKAAKRSITTSDLNIEVDTEELPITAVIDGRILSSNLQLIGLDDKWLEIQLAKQGVHTYKKILIAYILKDRKLIFQLKNAKYTNPKKVL